jgi:hypothetical protein
VGASPGIMLYERISREEKETVEVSDVSLMVLVRVDESSLDFLREERAVRWDDIFYTGLNRECA